MPTYHLEEDDTVVLLELLETALQESEKLADEYCKDESIADSMESFNAVTQDHTARKARMERLHDLLGR